MNEVVREILNIDAIRKDFPVLNRQVRSGVNLIYLDSAATAQKPIQVIDAISRFFTHQNANIHRGIHSLAEEATAEYESARERIGHFIGVDNPSEIVFTRNATESINLVASSWGRKNLESGDLVILSEMEHHANLVPWQMLSMEIGFDLEFIPVTESGTLELNAYRSFLERKPKLVAFTHMSNVLGTINPAKEMIADAHAAGAIVLLDGAQSVPHFPVNVKDLGADFLAFSGHKMCGPTGIGVLYGRETLLESMPPYMGGGDMIKKVELRSFIANDLPYKFEAGTPAIAEAIGLGAAVDYLSMVGMSQIAKHEHEITVYAHEKLEEILGLEILGKDLSNKGAAISFTLDHVHPHDVAQILDSEGIAVRAGHHCAMPLHKIMGVNATSRASFYLYNSTEEVDKLAAALYKVKKIFS
jgi:cysteine desulfurase/selenocysteine lyase